MVTSMRLNLAENSSKINVKPYLGHLSVGPLLPRTPAQAAQCPRGLTAPTGSHQDDSNKQLQTQILIEMCQNKLLESVCEILDALACFETTSACAL
eukprot:8306242-Pyramimonas_sp.AAC.1